MWWRVWGRGVGLGGRLISMGLELESLKGGEVSRVSDGTGRGRGGVYSFLLIFKVQLMLCLPCLLCLDSTLVSCVLEMGRRIVERKA